MKTRNKYFSLLLAFGLIMSPAQSQDMLYRSGLETPHVTGFYKIPITPELEARLKSDLSDLRIVDAREKEVPYVWGENSKVNRNLFQPFRLLQNQTDTTGTAVVFMTPGEGIADISLLIANNAVERTASLSGSNDGKSWYIIHEDLRLRNQGQNGEGHFIQTLNFPDSRYPFFKMLIHNRGTDPLNIVSVGQIEPGTTSQGSFVTHTATVFELEEHSDSRTTFLVKNDLPYIIERIRFDVGAPKFYDRQVDIYLSDSSGNKSRLIASGNIKSGNNNTIPLNGVKTRYLVVEVMNGDNPPLQVEKVFTEGRPREVIAWLDKEGNYTLVAGNPNIAAPSYDLARFRDSIPTELPVLAYSPPFGYVYSEYTGEEKSNWLWPAIIGMVAVLGFLTFRLMGEMRKKV